MNWIVVKMTIEKMTLGEMSAHKMSVEKMFFTLNNCRQNDVYKIM